MPPEETEIGGIIDRSIRNPYATRRGAWNKALENIGLQAGISFSPNPLDIAWSFSP
jgi:hypothetical protein